MNLKGGEKSSEIDTVSKTKHFPYYAVHQKDFAFFSKTFFNSLSIQEMKPKGGVKSIVLWTVTRKTNYDVCVFLLRMDGLGDSTHKIVSKKTP